MQQKRNTIHNDKCKIIVDNYENEKTVKEIAAILKSPRTSVQNVITRYKKEWSYLLEFCVGIYRVKIINDIKVFVQQRVDEKCDITIKYLSNLVIEKFSVTLATSSIQNYIRSPHYTLKRVKIVSERVDNIENIGIWNNCYLNNIFIIRKTEIILK